MCFRRNLGSEALEMHAAYRGKREDDGLFIHTTLLERSGLETGDNGNWNENRSRRTVCFVLYCKSPGVFALLYWLFGLESRAYSESARCFTTRFPHDRGLNKKATLHDNRSRCCLLNRTMSAICSCQYGRRRQCRGEFDWFLSFLIGELRLDFDASMLSSCDDD